MKISDIAAKIIDGDYPDIERPQEERVIICNDQITQYYATIVGTLLLNNVPADRANVVVPKRIRLFDNIMRTINALRIGRLSCLLEDLDAVVEDSKKDKDIWLSKKSANNICTFITEFWVWPDQVRVDFINGVDDIDEGDLDVEPAEDVDVSMVYDPEAKDAATVVNDNNKHYGGVDDDPEEE